MKKRIISIIVAAAMVVGIIPTISTNVDSSAIREEFRTFSHGDWDFEVMTLYWTPIEENIRVAGYRGTETDLVIPDVSELRTSYPFVNIKSYSIGGHFRGLAPNPFEGNTRITSIYFPDSITDISAAAFRGCTSLASVRLPNGIDRIRDWAFAETGLTSVTLPNSIRFIHGGAFQNCVNLETVTLNNGLITVGATHSSGGDVFSGCVSLRSIVIPQTVTAIGNRAFANCRNLEEVTIGSSVETIGTDAFLNTPWFNNQEEGVIYVGNVATGYRGAMPAGTSITLKEGTERIADGAFSGQRNLTSIVLPDSLTGIGATAFGNSGLTSVSIPARTTTIGTDAFINCSSLTQINVHEDNPYFSSEDGVLFNKTKTTIIKYPQGNLRTSYTMPESVTILSENVFLNSKNLTNITISNGVSRLVPGSFSGTSIYSIIVPQRVSSISGAFENIPTLTTLTFFSSEIPFINVGWAQGSNNITTFNIPIGSTQSYRRFTGLTSGADARFRFIEFCVNCFFENDCNDCTPSTITAPTDTSPPTTTTTGAPESSRPTDTTTTPKNLYDIDSDGGITISDALEILKSLAGLPSKAPNGFTIHDALEILKYLAGLPNRIKP